MTDTCNSNSASEASAKRNTEKKPVYKFEKLDHYAGIAILLLSAFLLAPIIYWIIKSWPT